jgi:Flp pilus assembly pilin Flp
LVSPFSVRFVSVEDRHAERGQTLTEYALAISLISVMAVLFLAAVGADLSETFSRVANSISALQGGSSPSRPVDGGGTGGGAGTDDEGPVGHGGGNGNGNHGEGNGNGGGDGSNAGGNGNGNGNAGGNGPKGGGKGSGGVP